MFIFPPSEIDFIMYIYGQEKKPPAHRPPPHLQLHLLTTTTFLSHFHDDAWNKTNKIPTVCLQTESLLTWCRHQSHLSTPQKQFNMCRIHVSYYNTLCPCPPQGVMCWVSGRCDTHSLYQQRSSPPCCSALPLFPPSLSLSLPSSATENKVGVRLVCYLSSSCTH